MDLAAASLDRGVKVRPLSWHRVRPGAPGLVPWQMLGLVLGYAANGPDLLAEGVAGVGAARRGLTGSPPRRPSAH